MRLDYMSDDESVRRFAGLIRAKLEEEARDYEKIIASLPDNWVELLTDNLREGVQKGVNTWTQELADGLTVKVRLDFELGYPRGQD